MYLLDITRDRSNATLYAIDLLESTPYWDLHYKTIHLYYNTFDSKVYNTTIIDTS